MIRRNHSNWAQTFANVWAFIDGLSTEPLHPGN